MSIRILAVASFLDQGLNPVADHELVLLSCFLVPESGLLSET